ncbi:uncharacterized protein SCHCODRAFT_02567148 [Schizophyllum commune H4-8]|uniref:Expressed protein n=1 Tax=Schizophyllum commune (strain H4-8 / FGSC 9210) TaxID=578458 RepID=D8PNB0_SCHCM|nr:uncharacterized protein SCHCODRAFT_02567148 [Schizophyllum commune H4-8]KAI5898594.1 hypothetical protein SCHCODRAFT_02567148 [Schizophyllum commune H4-8]
MASNTSIAITVAQAVAFLTRPLTATYPQATVARLQTVLEASLTAYYAPTWNPSEPRSGSGRRSLTLSPGCLPPRCIYQACLDSGVQWFDWVGLLGGREFDLFVDPGLVSLSFGKRGTPGAQLVTVWADQPTLATHHRKTSSMDSVRLHAANMQAAIDAQRKTFAQRVSERDAHEDEELFAMIAGEVAAPSWELPLPRPQARSSSPLSTHSRSSSRSSNSSSGFSAASAVSSATSYISSAASGRSQTMSRRERARQARVYVDHSKKDVTPYDGGKTTVLTGGVMLGGGPRAARA